MTEQEEMEDLQRRHAEAMVQRKEAAEGRQVIQRPPTSNVRTYSRERQFNDSIHIGGIATSFTVGQFASGCGSEEILICDLLIYYLQTISEHFEQPITITSGHRTPDYSVSVSGFRNDQHTTGMAADFRVHDITPSQVQAFARELGFGSSFGELGLGRTFTHIDTRTTPAVWNY